MPEDPRAIVSPADGKVIYIRRLKSGSILRSEKKKVSMVLDELEKSNLVCTELWHVGISMVFTNVHVNRAPISGKVILIHHCPGKFLSLGRAEAAGVNERQTMVIENDAAQIATVQIASRLVRRIQAFISEGDRVEIGQRIGMIKFGSQVDLLIPTAASPLLNIKVGQHLLAGETIVGRLGE
jgi:phosphatidylserine decarboxylase